MLEVRRGKQKPRGNGMARGAAEASSSIGSAAIGFFPQFLNRRPDNCRRRDGGCDAGSQALMPDLGESRRNR